jgi:hypothetical protein
MDGRFADIASLLRFLAVAIAVALIGGSSADAATREVVLAPTGIGQGKVVFALHGMTPQQVAGARAVCPRRRVRKLSRRRLVAATRRGRIRLRPRPCRARTSLRGGWRLAVSRRRPRPTSDVVFRDRFDGPDALITNHYARWTDDPLAAESPSWAMDSGSMFRRKGAAWTGVPSCNLPNRTSSNGSGSAIFRAHLTKGDLPPSYRVTFELRNNGFTDGCRDRPAAGWNGVKIYLRRVDGDNFYTAEVSLRDGKAYIQKKVGGRYYILAQSGGHAARIGAWEHVGGAVRTNRDGSVTVQVIRAGTIALEATDRGVGGAPIAAAGRTGFRGDNTDFAIDDFTVSAFPH